MTKPLVWSAAGDRDLLAEIHGRSYRVRRLGIDEAGDGDDRFYEVAELSPCGRWHVGHVGANLDAAKADAEARGLHHVELARLDRTTTKTDGEEVTILAEGVTHHASGRTGEIRLSAERNAAMPDLLRLSHGNYECDVDWARVAMGLPTLFTVHERGRAARTLKAFLPEVHVAWSGR